MPGSRSHERQRVERRAFNPLAGARGYSRTAAREVTCWTPSETPGSCEARAEILSRTAAFSYGRAIR